MNLAGWTAIAAIVAAAANVFSLVAVAYQLRSLTRQTLEQARQASASAEAIRAATYVEVVKTQIDQDRFFALNPQLRRYVYGDASGVGSQECLHQAEASAEMFIDMVDLAVALRGHLPSPMMDLWDDYATDVMFQSAHVRVFWSQTRHWYSPDLQGLLDKALAEADLRLAAQGSGA